MGAPSPVKGLGAFLAEGREGDQAVVGKGISWSAG